MHKEKRFVILHHSFRFKKKQFKKLNPIQSVDDKEAKIQEAKLAEKLRKKGWGVWQN